MLAVWVPELPFQMACGADASLGERPLAFLNPESPRSPTLWFVNRMARAEGLKGGEAMDQARRLVPGLRVLEPQPQTWWEAQGDLADFLQRWTPQGQLGRLGEALVELKGTERLLGPAQDLAWRIQRELQASRGWWSHGGLSESATAAQLAARLEHGLERVPGGDEADFLAPHPLRHLADLSPRLRSRFHHLGLFSLGDLQPLPLPVLAELVPAPLAPRVRQQARGEDRPRLPLLTERPDSSRHQWRPQPPRLPEDIALAPWILRRLWEERRSPRKLSLRWWDVDGESHFWRAPEEDLVLPPLLLAQGTESAFREAAVRRCLVRQLELRVAWGLGRARSLFQEARAAKLERLEQSLDHLRRRFPRQPVLPGWSLEGGSPGEGAPAPQGAPTRNRTQEGPRKRP